MPGGRRWQPDKTYNWSGLIQMKMKVKILSKRKYLKIKKLNLSGDCQTGEGDNLIHKTYSIINNLIMI